MKLFGIQVDALSLLPNIQSAEPSDLTKFEDKNGNNVPDELEGFGEGTGQN